jgi:hypothetical protein
MDMRQVRELFSTIHFHAPFSGHATIIRAQQMETAKTQDMFKLNVVV